MKRTGISTIVVILATVVASVLAFKLNINPPIGNIVGAFASIAAWILVARILKFDANLYTCGMIFIFFASPVGSILNLYRTFDPYDKIVHVASGILIAAIGVMLWHIITKRINIAPRELSKLAIVGLIFAFFVSSAGAGLWEIFEFVADKLAGGEMQRGMVDTVTDMIAGNIGALIYSFFMYKSYKRHRII